MTTYYTPRPERPSSPAPAARVSRTARRRRTALALTLAAILAVLAIALGASVTALLGSTGPGAPSGSGALPAAGGSGDARGATGGPEAGEVPHGTAVDSDTPGVANLETELRTALVAAARDASRSGITFIVNSGWRSPGYQEALLEEAVSTYGSRTEAARWVATAETSAHVSGEAVDIGSWDASSWLSENGARYGLCQIYDNEAWHFELRPSAPTEGCPRKFFDPTYDPRMAG